jgi:hypothetical protein
MKKNDQLHILLVSATIFFSISFWLHFPILVPKNYTDIVDVMWLQREGVNTGKIPYVDYNLEYPALSGIILYISSLTGSLISYYTTLSGITYLCMMGSLYLTYKIGKSNSVGVYTICLFTIFTPSFIYFSVYSFDWLGVFFLLLSVFLLMKNRVASSGLSMGLAGAARIIPLVCLPLMVQDTKGRANRIKLIVFTALGWLVPNIYFILANFKGFLYTYTYQAEWRAEDSWLLFFPEQSHLVTAALLPTLLIIIMVVGRKASLVNKCWFALVTFVLVSYKFPPQYMIMLAPFFALACHSYLQFILTDLLNAMVTLWWFTPYFNLGNPWVLGSPVQWLAIIRQALLAYILLTHFREKYR